MTDAKPRVFSGIQPSGTTHIGNYLGALRQWAASQDRRENVFCIVDLHAITVRHDPAVLRAKIREVAGLLLAAGIDPDRSSLFVQSHVPAHCELAWLFNCVAPMGALERMTQYKEKSRELKERSTVGLFTYPLLMAADILLYQTDEVPVGADQRQHVELTRDLARSFNQAFGPTFELPRAVVPPVGARIMGLDEPTRKMSKSSPNPHHAVGVLDAPDEIRLKFRRAKTDSGREIAFDESRPGLYNLLTIYQAFSGLGRQEIERQFQGKTYERLKTELAELVIESLRPVRARYAELTRDVGALEAILERGAERVAPRAARTLALARERMGVG
jgi:tryptophanyl-tRNA synthetase